MVKIPVLVFLTLENCVNNTCKINKYEIKKTCDIFAPCLTQTMRGQKCFTVGRPTTVPFWKNRFAQSSSHILCIQSESAPRCTFWITGKLNICLLNYNIKRVAGHVVQGDWAALLPDINPS